MSDIETKLTDIIVDILGVDEDDIVASASFREDLDADSLDLVELIMAFEEEFGEDISDEEAKKIQTVGEAIAFIEARVEAAA